MNKLQFSMEASQVGYLNMHEATKQIRPRLTAKTTRFFHSWPGYFSLLFVAFYLHGCTGVNTFPTVARPGDTVSVMVGGSEQARKDSVTVSLKDKDNVDWDLQALGRVRSVFNLRAAGTAYGTHYSSWLDSEISWLNGHEPVQTVLIFDVPQGVAIGPATLSVDLNSNDDSSGLFHPVSIAMDVIEDATGTSGTSDQFLRQNFNGIPREASLEDLEPAPYAKISFGGGDTMASPLLYATSLVVDFDQTIVNGDDLNVYVSESTVRGSPTETGAFGSNQRGVYWKQDGDKLFIDIVAPQGIEGRYLQVFVVHPRGLTGDPTLSLESATNYDINGNDSIVYTPSFEYFP